MTYQTSHAGLLHPCSFYLLGQGSLGQFMRVVQV
jgi:hypothetical protein